MSERRAAFRLSVQVRFRDCDSMGHVNHAVFFTFLEQCRLMFWRSVTGEASPLARVIVAHAECDYRAPAYFADELEIRLNIGDIGRSSFVLTYDVENITRGGPVAEGKTVMVTYDYAARKSVPIPDATRRLLETCRTSGSPSPSASAAFGAYRLTTGQHRLFVKYFTE